MNIKNTYNYNLVKTNLDFGQNEENYSDTTTDLLKNYSHIQKNGFNTQNNNFHVHRYVNGFPVTKEELAKNVITHDGAMQAITAAIVRADNGYNI